VILSALLAGIGGTGQSVAAATDQIPRPVQRQGKASPAHVGSAMAVLATLDQAQVLPPEGTIEANRIVQAVIQFQSAFTTGDDPAIQEFASRAVAARHGARAAAVLEESRAAGWKSELLECLAEAEARATEQDLQTLKPGLARYNVSVEDLHRLMHMVREARRSLQEKGLDFHRVYAEHRRAMPGAASPGTRGRSGTAD